MLPALSKAAAAICGEVLATSAMVSKALIALRNLEHRGARGAEPDTGDGAGLLIQIPDEFYREVVDFELPPAGSYATGIAFLPQSSRDAAAACAAVEKIAEAEGLQVLGWRNVPTDDVVCGAPGPHTRPKQCRQCHRGP